MMYWSHTSAMNGFVYFHGDGDNAYAVHPDDIRSVLSGSFANAVVCIRDADGEHEHTVRESPARITRTVAEAFEQRRGDR